MTENIAKDKNTHSKAGIALAAVILGGPFVYLGLILIVLYRPEVMTWLGLEPFVAYLIELQPAGYQNLVRLNGPAFADYFFHFHAASLLIIGLLVIVTVICVGNVDTGPPFYKRMIIASRYSNEYSLVSASWIKPIAFVLFCLSFWSVLYLPQIATGGSGKTSVLNEQMISVVFGNILATITITTSTMFCSVLAKHYWPKLRSWLVNKRKPNQNINHRAKQHHRED